MNQNNETPLPDQRQAPLDNPTIDWHGEGEPTTSSEQLVPEDVSQAEWLDELTDFDVWKDSEVPEDQRSKLAKFGSGTADTIAGATVVAELTPLNEAMRVAVFAAAQKAGLDPLHVGMIYGGATGFIEGAATFAGARMLHTKTGRNVADKTSVWVEKGLNKVGLDKKTVFNPAVKGGAALVGGSAVAMAINNIEDPERTKSQDRKYGFVVSAGLAGFCAVQGYFMSRGMSSPGPETIGTGAFALASPFIAGGWLKRRARLEREARMFAELQEEQLTEEAPEA